MNYIYAINIDGLYRSFDKALVALSEDKRQDILRFRQEKDRHRKLVSMLLLRYIIRTHLSVSDYFVSTNSFGKPFLEDYPEFQFNISHSGDWVVAVVSNKAVGIDVEFINETKDFMEIAKRFYSKEEYNHIVKGEDKSKLALFFDIWTKKESLIKAVGKGLSISLKSFTVPFETVGIAHYSDYDWNIRVPEFRDDKYKIAVCLSEPSSLLSVKYLTPEDVFCSTT